MSPERFVKGESERTFLLSIAYSTSTLSLEQRGVAQVAQRSQEFGIRAQPFSPFQPVLPIVHELYVSLRDVPRSVPGPEVSNFKDTTGNSQLLTHVRRLPRLSAGTELRRRAWHWIGQNVRQ